MSNDSRAYILEQLTEASSTEVETRHGAIRMASTSPLANDRARSFLVKEPDTIAWIDSFEADSTFWDVGANIGTYTLYATKRGSARVLAFEPSAANYQLLCRNIQLNEFSKRAQAYCLAFSDETKLGHLNLTSTAAGAALNQFGEAGEISRFADGSSQMFSQGMIGFTIDEFIATFGAPAPQYLKLDVDGIELTILRGAIRTLSNPSLKSVLVELTTSDSDDYAGCLAIMSQCGFSLTSQGEIQSAGEETGRNHIFHRSSV